MHYLKPIILPLIYLFALTAILSACTNTKHDIGGKKTSNVNTAIPEKIDFNFHIKPILSDRCFACHGPDEQKVEAGLALHTEEKAFAALGKHKDHYAIVAGNVEESTLIQRIFSKNQDSIMPPPSSNLKLEPFEKELLKKWIEQGAEWKKHWAFTPPIETPIPKVMQKEWTSNPIDHFILQQLELVDIAPSNLARPEKILRRLSFDIRGLPPTIEELKEFTANPDEASYQKFVDNYLQSDAYAERMTSEWLDLARYADTHGYQDDLERIMWPWRDWVIHAFRQNMPYNQFATWQLAGDLLPNPSREQIIATAFNRNHKITQEGGVISEEYRAEYVTDRTNTFGTAFLGLTLECAKCHDHKYDPISQKEYFQLFSYFNNVAERGLIENYGEIPKPYITLTQAEIQESLTFINNIDTLEKIPLLVMEELEEPRQTHVLERGLYNKPTVPVEPAVLSLGGESTKPKFQNRLDLAQWLFAENHPLTARVVVNRIWKQFFGRGLVASSFDFGNQGALPSHPELLDHLARKLQKDNWDLHKLIRYIVSSTTYRQSSKVSSELLGYDPDNELLARAQRARLTAEMLRDHALSISGLLVETVGGPSVKPYQPAGLWAETTGGGGGSTAKYVQDEGDRNYRRSLYTFWKRTVPPPNMMTFDAPSRDLCSVQRENTNTPLQALVLMNDPQFLEAAKALAFRALGNIGGSTEDVIQYMFTLATSRQANARELKGLEELFDEEFQRFKNEPAAAKDYLTIGSFKGELENNQSEASMAAYAFIASAILNLDETIRKG